jgi:hypothetical protein
MADDRTADGQPWKAPTKEERRAERARIVRHSRLPGPFYDYAQRGRRQARLVSLLQIALSIGLTLLVARLVTGEWFPPWVALAALTLSYVIQGACRYANARAGRP